jgi:uncharacterized membrane protein (UPF0127 family)
VNTQAAIKGFLGYFLVLVLGASAFFMFLGAEKSVSEISAAPSPVAPMPQETSANQASPMVQIAATKIPVEIATSSAAHQKGLSGRRLLDADRGMLFIFSRPDRYRFWMPDMYFPLDMIWIQDNKVVDIDKDVSNEFNPAAPKFYTPSSAVRYVLEVNAGFSMRHGIRIGDAVTFTSME